jgi:hypothetical protein
MSNSSYQMGNIPNREVTDKSNMSGHPVMPDILVMSQKPPCSSNLQKSGYSLQKLSRVASGERVMSEVTQIL